ncbi:hypothetical protein B0H10DRAFT_2233496 [Mycena sp. CBHHK59/15]|nr:hypothetical protein B0H10DRAFT_2233496 [Mycena sp. CBHHK59/15]
MATASSLPSPSRGLLHLHNHQGKTDTARYEGLDWYLSLRCVHLPALQLVPVQHPTDNHAGHVCVMSVLGARFGIAPPTEDLNRGVAAVFRAMTMSTGLNDVVVIFAAKHPMLAFMHICLGMVRTPAFRSGVGDLRHLSLERCSPSSSGALQLSSRPDTCTELMLHALPDPACTHGIFLHWCDNSLPRVQSPPLARDNTLPPARQRQLKACQGSMSPAREGSMLPKGQGQGRPPASGGGPAMFAEMGFTGAKAEDKEPLTASDKYQSACGNMLATLLPLRRQTGDESIFVWPPIDARSEFALRESPAAVAFRESAMRGIHEKKMTAGSLCVPTPDLSEPTKIVTLHK